MSAQLPVALKAINPFLRTANDMRSREDVIAYYCELHAMQTGMKIGSAPESKKFLIGLMGSLEKQKGILVQDEEKKEALSSDVLAQTIIENKAMALFNWADNKDRNAEFNKNVVKAYYTSAILFDVAEGLGELGDEGKHRKYARWKATYIHTCLKNGETPQPGPLGMSDEWLGEDEGATGGGTDTIPSVPSHQPSSGPSNSYAPSPPKPAARSKPTDTSTSISQIPYYDESVESKETGDVAGDLSPAQYNRANKLCKYASSAIMYQDVPTAVENLEKCIRLLKTGQEDP